MHAKSMVQVGLLIGIAAVLHIVESWLPLPLPLPGAKLGLANVISLVTIVCFGWRQALYVSVGRVLLGSVAGGVFLGPAFVMSISGALGSLLVMDYAWNHWRPCLSIVGISVLGAFVHNSLQLVIASQLVSNNGIFWYLPWLTLFALPTGIGTGLCAAVFFERSGSFLDWNKNLEA
ncbi:Gx transporter family protein [Anaerospora hongkongensis]|uniref:Gx transporter family protein n=1 Tax=Anaerospora hongkongensis TaxID=244830 RepID=UPI002FD9B1C5